MYSSCYLCCSLPSIVSCVCSISENPGGLAGLHDVCLHCPNIKCVLYVSKFGVLCTPSFSIPFWVCLTHLRVVHTVCIIILVEYVAVMV